MFDSLNPVFVLPQQADFKNYVSQVRKLESSSRNKNCNKGNAGACAKLISQVDKLELPYESKTMDSAKANITSINKWLESLSLEQNRFALKPLTDLFKAYTVKQNYLSALLRVSTPATAEQETSGLTDFLQSLEKRVPEAYKASGLSFKKEYNEVKSEFINNFGSELKL